MAGHSRWRTLQAKRLAETGDVREHPEYEQAGRDLRLGDQLRAIRRSRNLTQKEVAERAGISQPALSRIELGGGVPDIETLRRLGNAMGVRFHVIVGNEEADHDENLLVSLAKPRLAGTSTEASHNAHNDSQLGSCARVKPRRNSDHASLCWRRRLVGYQCPCLPSDRAHWIQWRLTTGEPSGEPTTDDTRQHGPRRTFDIRA